MHISQLPYPTDSANIFAHFAGWPYAVFLDSCGMGRFDIIAANPNRVIVSHNPEEDVFTQAKQQLCAESLKNQQIIPAELPFTIGAIGYFSYDLGYTLEKLNPTKAADVNLPAAVVGFYDWSIVIDHQERSAYFISRESQDTAHLKAIKARISQPLPETTEFALIGEFSSNMQKTQYTNAFNQVKQHIQAGDCYQINLAMRFSAAYQGSPWAGYQRLRTRNPMPMAAFMNLQKGGIICLSPERFLQVNQGHVLTQPIKGTSPRFADPDKDRQSAQALLESIKDRAENMMIVDLMRNDLGKCCQPGSIQVPKLCSLESFASVHHLISTVTGILEDNQHPFDLLRLCFPGGSITGAPKRRAMEIIDQLEPHRRSLYCGSIAYCDVRGRMDSNIAIRTLLCSDRDIYCYGGGGIVSDSTVESEFQEIHFKISKLLRNIENKLTS